MQISAAAPRERRVVRLAGQSWMMSGNGSVAATDAGGNRLSHVVSVLFRTHRCHPLLVGLPGIGRTHAVQDLARQASTDETPFLSEHKFRWIDCRHVSPEDSRACLESIFSSAVNEPKLVLCLDGIVSLLRRTGGGSNRPLLCGLLDRPGLRVIGVMTPWEYADLVAGDAEMLRYFARVDLHEPDESTAEAIAAKHAAEFAQTHDVEIAPELVRRTVQWTSHFLLNEYHPAKDINVLREACERLAFERLMQHSDRQTLELSDIAAVLHERTGIPAETLLGCGDETDFAAALSAAVVGQSNAVETAARELRLIKAGLSAPGKPASVMLFAGLTGVGKTELAKRIAEVYSTSHRLQVYSMGNFTEPHSVSGLIGVPPGYVGHDQGGRLINDLNADPYSVFLLDEAEKCHPNIWKPFLNLFDEGWIADQRGVKAHADRAIFILTTNAGDRHIAQLAEAGKSEDEIGEAVRQTLSRIRLERSTQPVFPPQFLSRIRRIVVFRPLDEAAMIAIAQQACQRLIDQWRQKRETTIEIAPEVPEAIGRLAHQLNQASHQQEGGRVIQKLIDQLLQDGLQNQRVGTQSLDSQRHAINVITLPCNVPATQLCVSTVGSPGYEASIDDLLDSIRRRGKLQDALLAVFWFGATSNIREIAERHEAIVVPCFELLPVNAASKAVLYSVARVIRAEKYLCLDADLLVLNDLRPLVAALDTVAPNVIFARRDEAAPRPLERALLLRYGGAKGDLGRLAGGDASQAAGCPQVVCDRMFAGSYAALSSLDDHLRSLVGAAEWVDERRSAKPARSQCLFNLALAQAGNAVELSPRSLVDLAHLATSCGDALQRIVELQPTAVHVPRFGGRHVPRLAEQLRQEFRPSVRGPIRTAQSEVGAAVADADPAANSTAFPPTAFELSRPPVDPADPLACAIIIPCHNYGRFLAECLDSVLAQTRPPAEILVVLDDCTDNSADVAASYRDRGVQTLVVRCCDIYLTRREGLRATMSPIVSFLDADDRVSDDYLAAGLPLFQRPSIGMVTSAIHEFGNSCNKWCPEPCNLEQSNWLSAAALVRRLALEGTQAMDQLPGIGVLSEDWFVWKHLVRSGWEVGRTTAVLHYRRHDANNTLNYPDAWAIRFRAEAKRVEPAKRRVGIVIDECVAGDVTSQLQLLAKFARAVEWSGLVIADGGRSDDDAVSALNSEMPVWGGIPPEGSGSESDAVVRRSTAAEALDTLLPNVDVLFAAGRRLGPLLSLIAGRVPIVLALPSGTDGTTASIEDLTSAATVWIGAADCYRAALPPPQRSRMLTVRYGADFGQLGPPEERWAVRRHWGLNYNALAIGFVGAWTADANPRLVAEAVAILGPAATAVFCCPDCRNDSPPLDAITRQRIQELVQGRVVWTWSETRGEVYRALDCLVVPSHVGEGQFAAIEALGTSCPLVAAPAGMLADLPTNRERLFVSLSRSPSASELAAAIQEAISPGNAATVDRGRNHAWRELGAKRMTREWEAAIRQAVELHRPD